MAGECALARALGRAVSGEVLFDRHSRGRYATDASIYQIEPLGVVVPRDRDDIAATLAVCAEHGAPVLARGGGTSQCGQTVGEAVVVDVSKHLRRVIALDAQARTVVVEPGIVLDQLNARLAPHGLFFPVDVSTASRATIGGMAGNNSCGARSIRYGNMVHNVRAIDALLSSGQAMRFAHAPANPDQIDGADYRELVRAMRALAASEADEIARRVPKLLRRVGGYNIDSISESGHNMAALLVGSEGTLGFFTAIELELQPIPAHKVLGVCRFPSLRAAMAATRDIVALGPDAVELADRTLIDLARARPLYAATVARFFTGDAEAVLLVEFTGEEAQGPRRKLGQLVELMGDLGASGAVEEVLAPGDQKAVWEVRKAGLNIMMSMKGDGKPISFIEDCAVGLDDLADYTDRLTDLFARHGTTGTWYAHASVGCLHVRPVLNMKDAGEVAKMRAIAEEAFAIVREYKGSHSGEHGDGLTRSEFHRAMFGDRLVRVFEAVKDHLDPAGLLNPGKIVRAPKMDDRSLFRYPPGYRAVADSAVLDWSEWGGFLGAVEMCNNNGACRKADAGVMCPSYRATGDERHLTRGRANSLRLALTGQLGPDALAGDDMAETMALCVGCKACRRECPTGVDMARMKIEVLDRRRRRHGLSFRDRLLAWLPRYAPLAARARSPINLAGRARWLRAAIGFAKHRPLPRWAPDPFLETPTAEGKGPGVVLFADTFTTWFEPDNARAARQVLTQAGYRVRVARAAEGGQPLCCGRTFLAAGLVNEARIEARRMLTALQAAVAEGTPVVGLEPACLLTLRDEVPALLPGAEARALAASAQLFEEFLLAEREAGRLDLALKPVAQKRAWVHGHCHQKAFGADGAVRAALDLIPELEVTQIESTCCGMAGSFGHEAEHYAMSLQIGELDLLPAVRALDDDALLVADGISCRQQIRDRAGRESLHAAQVLRAALDPPQPAPNR
ncbi:MAG: FAD-linked oxidase C-terminal domain-containing protein [Alphaproteobacteria bacterium]|nr:FAD-linked oxidase C-terminal domain-containing protein [Alphaproteobacteria bacterium]